EESVACVRPFRADELEDVVLELRREALERPTLVLVERRLGGRRLDERAITKRRRRLEHAKGFDLGDELRGAPCDSVSRDLGGRRRRFASRARGVGGETAQ